MSGYTRTPGPWSVVDGCEGEWPWLVDAPICTVAGVSGIGGAEAAANAHLIAASPDLLEALETCLAEIVTLAARVNPQARANLEGAAEKGKAAIAKAEGR